MRLRELLRGRIPDDLLPLVPRSFDIIGSREGAVAIIEIPDVLEPWKHVIGEALMKVHKHVRVVLRKCSERKGMYRLREYEVIAGSGSTEVIHKEYGCRIKVDPTKAYFSPRDSTERLRIAKQVRPGEVIMYMFAGVGPYALIICRVQPKVHRIVSVEINPHAYQYMIENIALNRVEDRVVPVLGDVREVCPYWYGICDRVLMPLPKGAYQYLDIAIKCLKPEGGILHFYHWAPEDRLFDEAEELIRKEAEKLGRAVRILNRRIVHPYAPYVYKICIDAYIYEE